MIQPLLCYFMSVKMGTVSLKLKRGIGMELKNVESTISLSNFKSWPHPSNSHVASQASHWQSEAREDAAEKPVPGMVGHWRVCTAVWRRVQYLTCNQGQEMFAK